MSTTKLKNAAQKYKMIKYGYMVLQHDKKWINLKNAMLSKKARI